MSERTSEGGGNQLSRAAEGEQPLFALSAKDGLSVCGVDPDKGLSESEVTARQERWGPNALRKHRSQSWLMILARQFRSAIVWLLAGGAAFSLLIGDRLEAAAILVVLALNSAIGFFTELRARRSMEALQQISQFRTRVRRGGEVRMVDAKEVTPGDIVVLEAGDVVTADLRLIEAHDLECDESALTGESAPVTKSTSALPQDTPLADRVNLAFKGTAVTRGEGAGVVAAVGMATEIGRISELAEAAKGEASPLQERLDVLGRRLLWLTLAVAALIVLTGVLRGRDLAEMIQTGVALAVAAVPEGLPVVATLCLARGMWRLAERNALITRLSSVETLGATTVVLTDKTGTLTENRMTVVRYLLSEGDEAEADERGRFSADKDKRLRWALRIGALCNAAEPAEADDEDRFRGEPMETALLKAARDAGLDRAQLLDQWPLEKEHPFDPSCKMMATAHRGEDGVLVAVKGAPEAVLEVCDKVLTADGETDLDEDQCSAWRERTRAAAGEGLRLLALAMGKKQSADAEPYAGLTLVGLVGFLDPLRKDVPEAIKASRAAGVKVVMLTGDHAATAAKIAEQAGITDGEPKVMTGEDLARLLEDGGASGARDVRSIDVFARVAPETKLDIVEFFQSAGEVVAMTGDGVNDAPALKKADIGVAMGKRGTEVAREAAAMVLKDDAFATIVEAMRQGRVIFDNIRKLVVFLLACNLSEILVLGLAVGVGLPTPLTALQILYLNLVTDAFPAIALGFGRGDPHVMTRPPRDPDEPLIDRAHWIWIAGLGASITAATLAAFGLALFWLDVGTPEAVTVAFLTLALSQNWNVFNLRAPDSRFWANDVTTNPYVWGALGLCFALIAGAVALPPMAHILNLPFPGLGGLALAIAASLCHVLAGQIGLFAAARRMPAADRA